MKDLNQFKQCNMEEMSAKEAKELDGGFMIPISWIVGAIQFVENAKTAIKQL